MKWQAKVIIIERLYNKNNYQKRTFSLKIPFQNALFWQKQYYKNALISTKPLEKCYIITLFYGWLMGQTGHPGKWDSLRIVYK